jgi:hypothetical protein
MEERKSSQIDEEKFGRTSLGLRRHGEEELELSVKNDLGRKRRKKELDLYVVGL